LSGDDRVADIDIPSQCSECGSITVIYDQDRKEVVCKSCGIVLDLGVQKEDAAYLLQRSGVTPRRLILEWCQRKAIAEAEHGAVDAKHGPELQRLEHQISPISGLTCRACRAPIMRHPRVGRPVGRLPSYCEPCRKKQRAKSSKRFRTTHPAKWRNIKRLSRERAKKIRKLSGQPAPEESNLGSKPLGRYELRTAGITVLPEDLTEGE